VPPERGRPPRIEVRFFGLFGPNGPLPLHLTEYARNRALHNADPTLVRFADIFHHRLLLLFYRAWAQAQPVVGVTGRATTFCRHRRLADRRGHPANARPRPDGRRGQAALRRPADAPGAQRRRPGQPAVAATWAGGCVSSSSPATGCPAADNERSRLGRVLGGKRNTSAQLGAARCWAACCGTASTASGCTSGRWTARPSNRLLPDGTALPAVMALVQQYLGHEFDWDLVLGHVAEQVEPSRLGRHARLGWTSWIGKPQPDAKAWPACGWRPNRP
jgi:type VI secretion system protein ImpH